MLATQRAYYYSNKFFAQQKSPIDDNIPKPKRKSGTSNRDIVFNIDYEKQIYQGKWTKKSVEYLKSLNLDVDFDKRGIADYHISEEGKQKVLTHLLKWHAGNEFLYGIKYFFNYYFVRAPKKLFRKIFKK